MALPVARLYVLSGSAEDVRVSDDGGLTFSTIASPPSATLVAAAQSDDQEKILFLAADGDVYESLDGLTIDPTPIASIGGSDWRDMICVDALGLYIACNASGSTSQYIRTSADGVTWTAAASIPGSLSPPDRLGYNAFTGQVIVTCPPADTQPVAYATDPTGTWTLCASMGTTVSAYAPAFSPTGLTVIATQRNPGDIARSADISLSWTATDSGLNVSETIAYADDLGKFAAGGNDGIALSTDATAVTWAVEATGEVYEDLADLIAPYAGGFMGLRPVSGSVMASRIVRSLDGTTWTDWEAAGLTINPVRLYELGTPPEPSTIVPNVVGQQLTTGSGTIVSATLQVGTVSGVTSDTVPAGEIISQDPVGGTVVEPYSLVNLVVSLGRPYIVPDIFGDTPGQATTKIEDAGLTPGKVTVTTEPLGPIGTVVYQYPPAGTVADRGDPVAYTVTALIAPFDVRTTVISQYSNSPTILRLVDDMAEYVDPRVNMTNFYNLVWNVDSAQGFGLDVWGRIVGVGRLLQLPSDDPIFGYTNEDDPPDWQPFNQGVFFPGAGSTTAYLLPDPAYRTLILTKALSNIVATNAPSLNQLLRNLFPGRGRCYVLDLGGMRMRFVFEFALTATEYAILTQSGALPHPAGVAYSVVISGVTEFTLGFSEAGSESLPFGEGVLFLPA